MAPAKKLEPGSQWSHLDRDGDGIITDDEIATEERMIRLQDLKSDMENEDAKQDAQRRICLLYTSPSPRDVEESRMPSSA